MLLSEDQVKELTGLKQPSAQIGWLRDNGFVFRVGADGKPKVAASHFDKVMGCPTERDRKTKTPDFSLVSR